MLFSAAKLAVLLLCHTRGALAFSLQDKRVIVTGSSGEIGRGIALELAEAGAHVLVHYNTGKEQAQETARLIRDRGGTCVGIGHCDFCHPPHIQAWFANQVDAIWPDGIDVLVNNAGAITKLALEDEGDDLAAWHDTIAVNLHAPRLLSHLAVKGMKRRGSGVIINVSSIHAERTNQHMSAYSVSKAGLDMLTKSMAMEYAKCNVRVNSIAPGPMEVERTADYYSDPGILVDEVARATIPLITNQWMTGTIWPIDGGMMARSKRDHDPVPAREPSGTTGPPQEPSGTTGPPQQLVDDVEEMLQSNMPGRVTSQHINEQQHQQHPSRQPAVPTHHTQGGVRPLQHRDSMLNHGQEMPSVGPVNPPGQYGDTAIPVGNNGIDPREEKFLASGAKVTTMDPRKMPTLEPLGGTSNPWGVKPKPPKRKNGLGGTSDPHLRAGEQENDSNWWQS